MKVLFLTNIPSPYRVNFFNELGKYCELTVLFEKSSSEERDDSWKNFEINNFKAIFLKGFKIGIAEAFCPEVIKFLNKNYDHIIVTNFSDLTGMLAILTLRLKKISYYIESDGGFAGTGKGLKERIKKWLLSGAKLYFSTSEEHDKYYLTYGAKKSQIVRYPFTSLFKKDILTEPVSQQEKMRLKRKLNMKEEKVIISVGQFIYRKGFDILLESLKQIDTTIGCYIIGGKPTDEYLKIIEKNKLNNVHFIDFMLKDELNEYYRASDLFVLPTREDIWGLVINEAMAQGLPVVTTNRCIAGLELIKKSKVGKVVQSENINQLANAITDELSSMTNEKSKIILNTIAEYTFENMALIHIKHLED